MICVCSSLTVRGLIVVAAAIGVFVDFFAIGFDLGSVGVVVSVAVADEVVVDVVLAV